MALIQYLTQVQFDFGAIAQLQGECARLNIRRPLLVTDAGVRAAGLVDRVLAQLTDVERVAVFDGTPPNPDEAAVRRAVAAWRDLGADGVIALGGHHQERPAFRGQCGDPRLCPRGQVGGGGLGDRRAGRRSGIGLEQRRTLRGLERVAEGVAELSLRQRHSASGVGRRAQHRPRGA